MMLSVHRKLKIPLRFRHSFTDLERKIRVFCGITAILSDKKPESAMPIVSLMTSIVAIPISFASTILSMLTATVWAYRMQKSLVVLYAIIIVLGFIFLP